MVRCNKKTGLTHFQYTEKKNKIKIKRLCKLTLTRFSTNTANIEFFLNKKIYKTN